MKCSLLPICVTLRYLRGSDVTKFYPPWISHRITQCWASPLTTSLQCFYFCHKINSFRHWTNYPLFYFWPHFWHQGRALRYIYRICSGVFLVRPFFDFIQFYAFVCLFQCVRHAYVFKMTWETFIQSANLFILPLSSVIVTVVFQPAPNSHWCNHKVYRRLRPRHGRDSKTGPLS